MHPQQPYDPYQSQVGQQQYPAQPYSAAPYPASPAPYQQPYPQQPPVQYVPAVNPTSGTAVVSLIAGIAGILGGWCLFGVPCLIAILAGHMALRETKIGARGGHGLAIGGLVLGYVGIVPAVLITIFFGVGMIASVGSGTTSP